VRFTSQPVKDPSPYPDVNAVLHELMAGIQAILGAHFLAMYLDGSLALGDFDPHSSDVDYVVLTDADLSQELLAGLQTMHAHFNGGSSPWATEVEAVYIPQDALRRYDPARACHPHIERGADQILHLDQLDAGWILHLHVLREYGLVVAGPAPRAVIDPVDPRDMRRAVADLMDVWWGPMCEDTRPLLRHHIGYQAYAVLTMCRILYTLDTADVTSKPAAARWVKQALGGRWSGLIDRALAWRKDHRVPPREGDIAETVDLIRYTHERCREVCASTGMCGLDVETEPAPNRAARLAHPDLANSEHAVIPKSAGAEE
jgi:hypothetical protein